MATAEIFSGPTCLLCSELICYHKDLNNEQQKVSNFLFGRDSRKGDLKSQLSIFFLLKKVLSLPQDFLEGLLSKCGSPSEWALQLCRHCTRLFQESEYLWGRLRQIQMDFDKVSSEIREIVTKSKSPDEHNLSKDKNGFTKNNLIGTKLKPSQIGDVVRKSFFLKAKDEDDVSSSKSEILNSNVRPNSGGLLKWNENGVPYLSLADFEIKMQKMVETVAVAPIAVPPVKDQKVLKEASSQTSDPPKQPSTTHFLSEDNDNEDEMEFEMDDDDPLHIDTDVDVDPLNVRSNIPPIPLVQSEPQSTIRIVQTSTLMEPEDNETDNDAVPHVIGILKHDPDAPIDLDSGDSLPDPLAINDDDDNNDPDYVPDSPAGTGLGGSSMMSKSSTKSKETKSSKKPEEIPSKFKLLAIQTIKKQPNVYECSKCKEVFEARVGCQSHILRDHYEDRQPFHCHVCSCSYSTYNFLKEHVRNEHGGIATPYDNNFNPATDYISLAMSKIIQDETEPHPPARRVSAAEYNCPLCPQKFSARRNVVRHAKTIHKVKINLPEGQSRKSSTDEQALSTIASPIEPLFPCSECMQRNIIFKAATREAHEAHMRRHHTGKNGSLRKIIPNKPPVVKAARKQSMTCPDCRKILPTVPAMAEHLKNPEWQCKECLKHFLFDMDLKRHVELEHTRGNRFQCPYCSKAFSAQIIYEKHVENHQIHDVHKCEFCQTKLTGYANMQSHMEIHADLIEQQQQQLLQDPLA